MWIAELYQLATVEYRNLVVGFYVLEVVNYGQDGASSEFIVDDLLYNRCGALVDTAILMSAINGQIYLLGKKWDILARRLVEYHDLCLPCESSGNTYQLPFANRPVAYIRLAVQPALLLDVVPESDL